jgi:hypothetical protein
MTRGAKNMIVGCRGGLAVADFTVSAGLASGDFDFAIARGAEAGVLAARAGIYCALFGELDTRISASTLAKPCCRGGGRPVSGVGWGAGDRRVAMARPIGVLDCTTASGFALRERRDDPQTHQTAQLIMSMNAEGRFS